MIYFLQIAGGISCCSLMIWSRACLIIHLFYCIWLTTNLHMELYLCFLVYLSLFSSLSACLTYIPPWYSWLKFLGCRIWNSVLWSQVWTISCTSYIFTAYPCQFYYPVYAWISYVMSFFEIFNRINMFSSCFQLYIPPFSFYLIEEPKLWSLLSRNVPIFLLFHTSLVLMWIVSTVSLLKDSGCDMYHLL
jgi:hypothetical protein